MKKILLILLLLLQGQLAYSKNTLNLPVYAIEPTEFQAMFKLITDEDYSQVILDCQSFIHGLNFYQENSEGNQEMQHSFYLDEAECRQIFEFIHNSLEKNGHACVGLDFTKNEFQLNEEIKNCN